MQAADRSAFSAGLGLSRMGLGTAAIADLYQQVPEAAAVQTVHAALDAGITYFDTAPHYALGVAEQRLGRALAGVDRSSYVVSTKVGRLLVPGPPQSGWLPARNANGISVLRAYAARYTRVCNGCNWTASTSPTSTTRTLTWTRPWARHYRIDRASRAGRGARDRRRHGRSGRAGPLRRHRRFDVILLAGRYTLLDQSALASLLPLCTQHSVGVVIGGVYNSGLLADPRPGARFNYRAAPPDALARAQALQAICAGTASR